MWKRDEAVKPVSPPPAAAATTRFGTGGGSGS